MLIILEMVLYLPRFKVLVRKGVKYLLCKEKSADIFLILLELNIQ